IGVRGAAGYRRAFEPGDRRRNRRPIERRAALLELRGAERIDRERERHLAGDDEIGQQRVALAHRNAVGGDDAAKQLQAAVLAEAVDHGAEPVAVLRLDAEPALPSRIEQVVVASRKLAAPDAPGV